LKNTPVLLSIAALALSITALVGAFRPRSTPVPTPRRISPVSTGKTETADVRECKGQGAVDTLQLLMRSRINPTMTRLSYSLYHDDRPKQARYDAAAEAAGVLLGCVEITPSFRPDIPLEGLPEYYRLLERMQANVLALQTSARELDEDGTRHWFSHLKHDCVECHSRFRLAAEGDIAITDSADEHRPHEH